MYDTEPGDIDLIQERSFRWTIYCECSILCYNHDSTKTQAEFFPILLYARSIAD